MIIGATAKIGIVCEGMIDGNKEWPRAMTWTMLTAIGMPSAVPKVKPSAVDDNVTHE